MRLLTFILLNTLALSAFAEPEAIPDNLVPLQEFDNSDGSADDGPAVTIIQRTEQTIEEYRAGGKLYMIKVIPKNGKPYFLVDERGDGKFSRQESLDSGVRPPRWVIHRF